MYNKRSSVNKYRTNEDLYNKDYRSSDSDGIKIKEKAKIVFKNKNVRTTIPLSDGLRLKQYMQVELACYNHIVSILGAQFIRDYTFFNNVTPEDLGLFSEMLLAPHNIYDNPKEVPVNYLKYQDILQNMDSKKRYVFSECVKNFGIIPEIRRRMGASIMWFFMSQSDIRYNNRYVFKKDEEESEQHSKVAYSNLTPSTIFHKRHLQIDRGSCTVTHDNSNDTTSIKIPYCKEPLVIKKSENTNKWNFFILKQSGEVETTYGAWVLDFKKLDTNGYMINFMDRYGHSSIFETAKMRLVKR